MVELQRDKERLKEAISAWFWSNGETLRDCAVAMDKNALDTVCGLLGYVIGDWQGLLSNILSPDEILHFGLKYTDTRKSGTAAPTYGGRAGTVGAP